MIFFIVPTNEHNLLVRRIFETKGFDDDEVSAMVIVCSQAAKHGIHTHNIIKAVHLDDLYGSKVGGCIPGAKINKLDSPYKVIQKWDANKKSGPYVALDAMKTCIDLADVYGQGSVIVKNCHHYLWGGFYVMQAAKKGYIAYTNCTSTLAEVVPYRGAKPTLGTNPHSWGFPTMNQLGYPITIDWASSKITFEKVAEMKREGKSLPPDSAIDEDGHITINPNHAKALLPSGDHKGYGLALVNELYAGFVGAPLPTLRGSEDNGSTFYFHVIKPDAINIDSTPMQIINILEDIKKGNPDTIFPGQLENEFSIKSEKAGGFIFTANEMNELNNLCNKYHLSPWDFNKLRRI